MAHFPFTVHGRWGDLAYRYETYDRAAAKASALIIAGKVGIVIHDSNTDQIVDVYGLGSLIKPKWRHEQGAPAFHG